MDTPITTQPQADSQSALPGILQSALPCRGSTCHTGNNHTATNRPLSLCTQMSAFKQEAHIRSYHITAPNPQVKQSCGHGSSGQAGVSYLTHTMLLCIGTYVHACGDVTMSGAHRQSACCDCSDLISGSHTTQGPIRGHTTLCNHQYMQRQRTHSIHKPRLYVCYYVHICMLLCTYVHTYVHTGMSQYLVCTTAWRTSIKCSMKSAINEYTGR